MSGTLHASVSSAGKHPAGGGRYALNLKFKCTPAKPCLLPKPLTYSHVVIGQGNSLQAKAVLGIGLAAHSYLVQVLVFDQDIVTIIKKLHEAKDSHVHVLYSEQRLPEMTECICSLGVAD